MTQLLLTALIALVALVIMIVGFWRPVGMDALVLWVLDTVLWLVWTYMLFNQALDAGFSNAYIPTALGVLGAGLVLTCIYKDFAVTLQLLHPPSKSRPMTYDEEKAANARRIYDITRRRNEW